MAMSAPPASDEERILRERATRLAQSVRRESQDHAELEVAICGVGEERFGIPVHHLREIVILPAIARLPGTPEWMLGIAQVRGTLLSVVDLGAYFRVAGTRQPTHMAILDGKEGPIGFTVDDVQSYRRITDGELDTSDAGRTESRATLGVTRDLVLVLDTDRLLEQADLVIG
jgi:purine-binding chemotaxis protein CheW